MGETFQHVPVLLFRTVIFFVLVLIMVRWMGARTIASLAPFDLVVVIMISEVASIPIDEHEQAITHGIVPVVALAVLHWTVTHLNIKFKKLEALTQGRPTLLIQDGRPIPKNLTRERMSMEDLRAELRLAQVERMDDVEQAWMEPTGAVSVRLKKSVKPLTPGDVKSLNDVEGIVQKHLDRLRHELNEFLREQKKVVEEAARLGVRSLPQESGKDDSEHEAAKPDGFPPEWGRSQDSSKQPH